MNASLFVTRTYGQKNSVAVISGTVTFIDGTVIKIENEQYQPVSHKYRRASILCQCTKKLLEKAKIKKGATVIAVIESNDDTDIVFEGGEINTFSETKCINLREAGSFLFSGTENYEMEEIICGTVSNEETGYSHTNDIYWHRYYITYNYKGIKKIRTIIEFNEEEQTESLKNKKAVFAVHAPYKEGNDLTAHRILQFE